MTDTRHPSVRASLKRAIEEVAKVNKPDDLDKKGAQHLDDETVSDRKSTRELRESYSKRVYEYLVWYSIAAFLVIILQGTHYNGFQLDSTVISIIVGSTAVSAIGLVGIVVRGLFK